jgi:hemerythrin-like domain-containing protein
MVRVLGALAARVATGDSIPAADVGSILGFFRDFVEGVHHRKEAEVLYPAALLLGGDTGAEAIGRLVADHDESKMLLHSLWLFWEPNGLRAAERAAFAELARVYASRLGRHMDEEEERLFPIARRIPPDDQLRLVDEFAALGAGARSTEHWEREVGRLERSLGG